MLKVYQENFLDLQLVRMWVSATKKHLVHSLFFALVNDRESPCDDLVP